MHGVTGSPLSESSIGKVWLLIKLLIYFKDSFNQAFLKSSINIVTSAKLVGSGMKCDTSNHDYPKVGNTLLSSLATVLNP